MTARVVTVAEHEDTPHGRCRCGRFGSTLWTSLPASAGFTTYLVGCARHLRVALDAIYSTDDL